METQTVIDEALGKLTWNAELDWWEGKAEVAPGHPIRFSITLEEDEEGKGTADLQETLVKAHGVLAFLREHEEEARIVAADELLEIYNAEWNENAPLEEEDFIGRLILDDVNITPSGRAELYYRDEGLFAGYAVVVNIDADGNFADADIAG
jgi:hypothetical protein